MIERLVLHFAPTSSSWMNLVERFFRDLSEDALREGSFAHVRESEAAIETYLAQRNLSPKRYVWKKTRRRNPRQDQKGQGNDGKTPGVMTTYLLNITLAGTSKS